eukprot:g32548.t1
MTMHNDHLFSSNKVEGVLVHTLNVLASCLLTEVIYGQDEHLRFGLLLNVCMLTQSKNDNTAEPQTLEEERRAHQDIVFFGVLYFCYCCCSSSSTIE